MANRRRDISKQFYVSKEEDDLIRKKMEQSENDKFGVYARKMLIDGYIIKTDYTVIKELVREINKIGVNINQISKRVNKSNRIYDDDIKEIREELNDIWQLLESKILKQS